MFKKGFLIWLFASNQLFVGHNYSREKSETSLFVSTRSALVFVATMSLGTMLFNGINADLPIRRLLEQHGYGKHSGITIQPKAIHHIFRKARGHMPDSVENRQLLENMVRKEHYHGIDQHGNSWYSQMVDDKRQLWASVRKQHIQNGGLNSIAREFNQNTGLCKERRYDMQKKK